MSSSKSSMSALSDKDLDDILDSESSRSSIGTYEELRGLESTNVDLQFESLANPIKLKPDLKLFDPAIYASESSSSKKSDTETKSTRSPKSSSYKKDKYEFKSETKSNFFKRDDDYQEKFKEQREKQKETYKKEDRAKKYKMFGNLYNLKKKGVPLTKDYTMADSYDDMEEEYNFHKSLADRTNGIKVATNFMINTCWLIELGNEKYDPFNFNLSGWAEQLANDSDNFYDVFGELYDKYTKDGKGIPPELKLIMLLGFSAGKYGAQKSWIDPKPLEEELDDNLREQLRENIRKEQIKKEEKYKQKNLEEVKKFAEGRENEEKLEKYYNEYNDENYYENKIIMKNNLIKQKEREQQELQEALLAQRSDAPSETREVSDQIVMDKPNFEYLRRKRQVNIDTIKDQAKVQKVKIQVPTPPQNFRNTQYLGDTETKSARSEIKYNTNIQEIIENSKSMGGSSYSSGSKRLNREKPIIV